MDCVVCDLVMVVFVVLVQFVKLGWLLWLIGGGGVVFVVLVFKGFYLWGGVGCGKLMLMDLIMDVVVML